MNVLIHNRCVEIMYFIFNTHLISSCFSTQLYALKCKFPYLHLYSDVCKCVDKSFLKKCSKKYYSYVHTYIYIDVHVFQHNYTYSNVCS